MNETRTRMENDTFGFLSTRRETGVEQLGNGRDWMMGSSVYISLVVGKKIPVLTGSSF